MNGLSRRGVTLLELLVTLCVLATMMAVVGVATSFRALPPPTDKAEVAIRAARAAAIRAGRPVTIVVERTAGTRQVTAFPDGRVIEDARPMRTDRVDGGAGAPR